MAGNDAIACAHARHSSPELDREYAPATESTTSPAFRGLDVASEKSPWTCRTPRRTLAPARSRMISRILASDLLQHRAGWNVSVVDGRGPVGGAITDVSGDRVSSMEITPPCLLYTSDAADDLLCVDLGGRRIIKKKK